jgi:mono/diheme cytochrome c family protein
VARSRTTRIGAGAAMTALWMTVICVRAAAHQQSAPPTPPAAPATPSAITDARSSMSGAYSAQQAKLGGDIFIGICVGCHTLASQTGSEFKSRWEGHSLFDLLTFVGQEMPKDDPGSLSTDEAAQVVAYLLKANGMPPSDADMPKDDAVLKKIKIEVPKEKRP